MGIALDLIVLLMGCAYLFCAFALESGIRTPLLICGSACILLSVLSFFALQKLRIAEIAVVGLCALLNLCNLLVYLDGKRCINPNYLIVPGAEVEDTKVGRIFRQRLDCAFRAYKGCGEKPKILVCGAVGRYASISEAEAGIRYLISLGVPPDRLIAEDASYNTWESFVNCKKLISDRSAPVLITTSNWGMLRAVILAGRVGLNAKAIGCRTSFLWYWCYTFREFFALIYNLLVRKRKEGIL